MFEAEFIKDPEGTRTCGTCSVNKSVDAFYSDGKDSDGNRRYRRDCKECYRVTRLKSRKKSKRKIPTVAPKRRRK